MTAAKKILNETKVRLRHGNMSVLVGAFSFILMNVLLVILFINISQVAMFGIFQNIEADRIVAVLCATLAFVAFVFLLPLLQGYKRMAYACAKGKDCVFSDLFYYCQSFIYAVRAIELQVKLFLRFILGAAVVATLIITLDYAVGVLTTDFYNSSFTFFLKSVEATVIVLMIALFIDFLFRYFLASYMAIENDFESTSFCIKSSVNIMKKYRLEIIRLVLSNFHLILLSLLIVPALYTVPKLITTFSVSAKWMIIASLENTSGQVPNAETVAAAEEVC